MPQMCDSNGNVVVPAVFTGAGSGQAISYTSSAASPPGALFTPKGKLLSSGVAPSDGDTVTIGAKTYTFKTTLTGGGSGHEGEVLINTTAAAALLNLIRAINHTGTAGTDYDCAAVNPDVTADAAVTASTYFWVYAILPTSTAALTAVAVTLSWSAAVLGGFALSSPQVVLVMCSTAAFIATGTAPVATVIGRPIAANTPTYVIVFPGDRVSAVQSASNGVLNVFEVY